MKYLTIVLQNVRIKGDPDDMDTLQTDLYEKLQTMIEAETLSFEIQDEEDDGDDEF